MKDRSAWWDTVRERDVSHAEYGGIVNALFSCGATRAIKDTIDQTDWYVICFWDRIRSCVREVGARPTNIGILPS